jgi:hypothetical protein
MLGLIEKWPERMPKTRSWVLPDPRRGFGQVGFFFFFFLILILYGCSHFYFLYFS